MWGFGLRTFDLEYRVQGIGYRVHLAVEAEPWTAHSPMQENLLARGLGLSLGSSVWYVEYGAPRVRGLTNERLRFSALDVGCRVSRGVRARV